MWTIEAMDEYGRDDLFYELSSMNEGCLTMCTIYWIPYYQRTDKKRDLVERVHRFVTGDCSRDLCRIFHWSRDENVIMDYLMCLGERRVLAWGIENSVIFTEERTSFWSVYQHMLRTKNFVLNMNKTEIRNYSKLHLYEYSQERTLDYSKYWLWKQVKDREDMGPIVLSERQLLRDEMTVKGPRSYSIILAKRLNDPDIMERLCYQADRFFLRDLLKDTWHFPYGSNRTIDYRLGFIGYISEIRESEL